MGDGIKLQGGKPKIFGFCNTELKLLKHFLNFSKDCLGIFPSDFNIRISIPPSMSNSTERIEKEISETLQIPLKNFWKTQIFERRNDICVGIKISSRRLGLFMDSLFLSTISILKSSQEFSASFLKGLIASEGNVYVRTCGRLGEVMIASHQKHERFLIRKLLEKLGIRPNKDKISEKSQGVLIHGFDNFKKLLEMGLCDLHPSKKSNLVRGLNDFKKIQFRKNEGRLQILSLIVKNVKTSKQLSEKLKKKQMTVNFHLRSLKNSGLIEEAVIDGRTKFWIITERGKNILEKENPLECLKKL